MIDLGYGQCTEATPHGSRCTNAAINDSGKCYEHLTEALQRVAYTPDLDERRALDAINQATHYGYDSKPRYGDTSYRDD